MPETWIRERKPDDRAALIREARAILSEQFTFDVELSVPQADVLSIKLAEALDAYFTHLSDDELRQIVREGGSTF